MQPLRLWLVVVQQLQGHAPAELKLVQVREVVEAKVDLAEPEIALMIPTILQLVAASFSIIASR